MNILAQLPARGPTKTWSAALKFEGSLMRMSLLICAALLAAILSGCGGGGTRGAAVCIPGVSTMAFPNGCPGDDVGSTVGAPSLSLKVFDPDGAATTQISPERSGTLQALVKDSTGAVAPNVAVTFTTNDQSGVFVPASGTALTDASGVARVRLPAGSQEGAFTVTARAVVGGITATGSTSYAVTSAAVTLSISLNDSSGAAINEVSQERPGTLQAVVKDSLGAAVPNVNVTFTTTDSTAPLMPTSGTALTDVNGVAQVGLPAGSQAGAFTATASAVVGAMTATGATSYAVTVPAATLRLSLKDSAGAAITEVWQERPGTLQALVKDSRGVAVPNVRVTFVTTDPTAPLIPSSGTALTNASGVAQVGLPAGSQKGAFTVTASAVVAGATATGSANYAVTSAAVTLALSLKDSAGAPTIEVSPERPGTLQALVRDTRGAAVPNVKVTFTTTDSTAPLMPASGTALTNASGMAQVGLPAGSQKGAFTATASALVAGTTASGATTYTVTSTVATLSLSLKEASGAAISEVSPEHSGTLQAVVRDSRGAPLPNVSVTFTTTDSTVSLMPSSGTALTSASGVAQVGLPAGSQVGAFTAKAHVVVAGTAFAESTDYAVTSPAVTLRLSLTDSTGAQVTEVTPDRPGTLQAVVKDRQGLAAANVTVTFTTNDITGSLAPASGTALTDGNGVARLGLPAGLQVGAFTITARASVAGNVITGTTDYEVKFAAVSLRLAVQNSSGVRVTEISPESPGTLEAMVIDRYGDPAPNVAVKFKSNDGTALLLPSSGTALTNANGVARVGLHAGSQAGAFTAEANAIVSGTTVSGTTDYAATFPTLSLSALTIAPATLAAGGTASLTVTVLNGANPFTPVQSVSFTSPCAAAGKAVIDSPAATVNGVASTSYIDKGCGGSDTITASTTLAGATATRTGPVTVLGAAAGQIAFVSALPQNIAMKGTGGAGRQESSTVIFKVMDRNGNPVAGVPVQFNLTTTVGGLTLNPAFATSDASGTASTVVAAGIVNTPVRVVATTMGNTLSTLSDQLVISTGIPDQNSFTVSPDIYNIECGNHDLVRERAVTAFVADHFNNPVPDGTAVSFTTEGGAIDASCLTGLQPPDAPTTLVDGKPIIQKGVPGQCTVRFICQNPRPTDGRSTVLAYALGEESFADDPFIKDGINRYDIGEPTNDLREPFRYDRAITNAEANAVNNGNNNAASPVIGEPFIDSDGNGLWNATGDGFYNGVLQTVPNGKTPTIHVRASFVVVFSGSNAVITPLSAEPLQLDQCTNGTPFVNSPRTLGIAIRDNNPNVFPGNTLPGNILPAGTQIEFDAANGNILGDSSYIVPNTNAPSSAAWTYFINIQSDATQSGPDTVPPYVCSNPVARGPLTVKVTTPLGVITRQSFAVID